MLNCRWSLSAVLVWYIIYCFFAVVPTGDSYILEGIQHRLVQSWCLLPLQNVCRGVYISMFSKKTQNRQKKNTWKMAHKIDHSFSLPCTPPATSPGNKFKFAAAIMMFVHFMCLEGKKTWKINKNRPFFLFHP